MYIYDYFKEMNEPSPVKFSSDPWNYWDHQPAENPEGVHVEFCQGSSGLYQRLASVPVQGLQGEFVCHDLRLARLSVLQCYSEYRASLATEILPWLSSVIFHGGYDTWLNSEKYFSLLMFWSIDIGYNVRFSDESKLSKPFCVIVLFRINSLRAQKDENAALPVSAHRMHHKSKLAWLIVFHQLLTFFSWRNIFLHLDVFK